MRGSAVAALVALVAPLDAFSTPAACGLVRHPPRCVAPCAAAAKPETLPQLDILGVVGQRAVVVVYSDDSSARVKETLKLFQDTAADYAARGCALVAVRSTVRDGLAERYPAFRFKGGLEKLGELRGALGLSESLQPVFFGGLN